MIWAKGFFPHDDWKTPGLDDLVWFHHPSTQTLSGHWKLHWAFGICEEVSERGQFPSRLGTYSATGNREQRIESMTSLWMGQRNPATTKRMVETL